MEEITIEGKIGRNEIEKYLKDPIFMSMVKKYAKESEELNKNKKRVDKEKDKIVKRIFMDKKEVAKLVKKVLGIEIRGEELEITENSFVTTELKYKEADIVYKLKGRNVVFLIEHQTKVDYKMPYRILNYQLEIMRANEGKEECLVIAIVLYTGRRKWTAKTYIREIQDKFLQRIEKEEKKEIGTMGYYTLIDVNKYSKEELLEEDSLYTKFMLMEKEKETKDIVKTVLEISERIKNKAKKEIIYKAMELALERKLGSKQAEEIMEKIIKEGSDYMLAIEQMVIDENRRIRAEGRNEGIIEGRNKGIIEGRNKGIIEGRNKGIIEGRAEGILQIIKEMLKNGMKEKEIIKYTKISKEEIEKIKKNSK